MVAAVVVVVVMVEVVVVVVVVVVVMVVVVYLSGGGIGGDGFVHFLSLYLFFLSFFSCLFKNNNDKSDWDKIMDDNFIYVKNAQIIG